MFTIFNSEYSSEWHHRQTERKTFQLKAQHFLNNITNWLTSGRAESKKVDKIQSQC